MKIRLSEEDAERLGCPRDLVFDESRLMGRELMALEEQVGWTFQDLERKLQGDPAVDHTGAPIWETDDKGKLVLADGKPTQMRVLRVEQLMVMAWLCAFRANPDVAWKTFDINLTGAEFSDDSPGKDPTPAASKPSTTSTRRRSARSSASPRGTSGKS